MRKALKTACAIGTALCLLFGTASASVEGLMDTLSEFMGEPEEMRMEASFELKTLMPFSEDTLAMCNDVLKHVSLNAQTNGDDAQLTLAADEAGLFTIQETMENGGATLKTTLLPNRVLTAPGSALEVLFPAEENRDEESFELLEAIAKSEDCYKALTDAIIPFAEEKKANYKIANIGYAKWVRLARLSPEDSATLLPQMIQLLGCGMDAAFQEQLTQLSCKNGFTIALYSAQEDGADLAVYMKGNVSLGEEDNRTLAYQWAFSREGGQQKDTYKLELIRSKSPAERRVIEASQTRTEESGKLALSVKSTMTIRKGKDTVVTTENHSLKGESSSQRTSLTGTLSTAVKTTLDGESETVTTELTPDLTLTTAEGSGVISGEIGVKESLGKNVQQEITIALDPSPATELEEAVADGSLYAVDDAAPEEDVEILIGGSSLAQNLDEVEELTEETETLSDYLVGQPPVGMTAYSAPRTSVTIALDAAEEEAIQALREEMYQYAAGYLLRAIAGLPGEDGRLLKDNMTDADFATFVNMLSEL